MALSLHGPLAELRNADVMKWVNAAILKENACNPLVGTPNFEEYPGVLEVRFTLTAAFRYWPCPPVQFLVPSQVPVLLDPPPPLPR